MSLEQNSELSEIFDSISKVDYKKALKTHESGATILKEGNLCIVSYKGAKLVIERYEDGDTSYAISKATDSFGLNVNCIDFEKDENTDPVSLFVEWVKAKFPSEEEISMVTGKPFAGTIKEICRYSKYRSF